jgi:lipoprotein-anchoring transpeptidase ErfK/SrfK
VAGFDVSTLLVVGAAGTLVLLSLCMLALIAGFGLLVSSDQVLPGVSAAGVDLGGMSEAEATVTLNNAWATQGILLRDGDRTWPISPQELGITLDAAATARAAREWGRSEGGVSGALRSLAGGVEIDPVLNADLAMVSTYLEEARSYVDVPAMNAGVRLVNGQAAATPAEEGRALNVPATVDMIRLNAANELADGSLDLVMAPVAPAITDSTPLVAQANALLASPFTVNAYDPIRDEWTSWAAPPDVWAAWLAADSAPGSSTGLALTMDPAGPHAFLQTNGSFPDERYIKIDEAVADMQQAIARNETTATVRVWHEETSYTVQPGQTLASIAEDVGIPYPYIQAVNPGINIDALYTGQVLTLPSKDILVPLAPVPNKRIVVSRSQQHLWAYENGQVVFDWVISTGLSTSPTALGVFQVQSHDINAYAEQWNLYMPHFMGFYHPGPNMDLMNGFHGFPTRGGSYLLWTNSLGTPVTYGCVLLSLENAEALYNWAEEGVVVVVKA